MTTIQVAYLLEQCWHPVPGGTAVAAVGLARALAARSDIELVGLAARHRNPPSGHLQPPVPIVHSACPALPFTRPGTASADQVSTG